MGRPMHRLSIASSQPGAVFRVTDGRSARVGTGMYRLELDLPQGLYTVSTMLGDSIECKEVLLDRSKTVEIGPSLPSFGDRAFAVAPMVMTKLPTGCFDEPGNAVVALRGPWRDGATIDDRVALDLDGDAIASVVEGTVSDPAGGIWSWQFFRVGAEASGAPGAVTAIRSVIGVRHSHVVPRIGNWVVWAAYPAPEESSLENADLPSAYCVRLRLTRPGSVPAPWLQGLSDQIFTALASRSTLPLSEPVLDILYGDEADPLLAMAATHVASLTLAGEGLLATLPQDAPPSGSAGNAPEDPQAAARDDHAIAPGTLHRRIKAWLERVRRGELADCPDMVAVRSLFGLETRIDLRRPPVLLRSLDALIKNTHSVSPEEQSAGTTLEESVWRTRFQVSDSFAYLQWEPDSDSEAQLLEQLERSFDLARTIEDSVQKLRARASGLIKGRAKGFTSSAPDAAMQAPMAMPEDNEFETFLKKNAQNFRIPASAVGALASLMVKSRSLKK